MQSGVRRSRLVPLLLSTHPGPTLAVTAVTVSLGVAVGLEPWRLLTLAVAMLLGQASVGLANDWLDADRDRTAGRTDKPLASGLVGIPLVRGAAFVALALAVVLTLPLGLPALLIHLLFLAAGWSYDLGLKATPLSVLPYLVGFAALPLFATLALARPAGAAWWAIAAGASLGVAAHFANTLPDLEHDRATGVVGLPHRVGVRMSAVLIVVALAAASGFVVFGPGNPGLVQWTALGAEAALAAAGLVLAFARPPGRALFRLVILGALVAVVALVLAGSRLIA